MPDDDKDLCGFVGGPSDGRETLVARDANAVTMRIFGTAEGITTFTYRRTGPREFTYAPDETRPGLTFPQTRV